LRKDVKPVGNTNPDSVPKWMTGFTSKLYCVREQVTSRKLSFISKVI